MGPQRIQDRDKDCDMVFKQDLGTRGRIGVWASVTVAVWTLAVVAMPQVGASDAPVSTDARSDDARADQFDIVYVPPSVGTPIARVSGGTRATGHKSVVEILAPRHTGLSDDFSPVLYWSLNQPSPGKTIEVHLTAVDQIEPVFSMSLSQAPKPGLQRLDLRDLGVTLEEGVQYSWTVGVLDAPGAWENAFFARGGLMVLPADEDQTDVKGWLSDGYWYDGVAKLGHAAQSGDSSALRTLSRLVSEQGGSL